MALSIVLLLLLVVVLPAFIIRTVWRQQPHDRFSWMMTTVTSGAFLLYTLVIGFCDGTVLEALDGLPDQIPPASDTENVAGNHVTIACAGVELVLSHLLRGSIVASKGETVTSGQPIARVGNSGNTTEPHLHVHAVRVGSGGVEDGIGMPIEFDGTFPVRNTTY